MVFNLKIISAAAVLLALTPNTAQAACYENIGCTNTDYFDEADLYSLSCQNLDHVRNSIYAENGYCFKKRQYQQTFGNRNCRFDTSSQVPLNRVERANIAAIISVERDKGCRG